MRFALRVLAISVGLECLELATRAAVDHWVAGDYIFFSLAVGFIYAAMELEKK